MSNFFSIYHDYVRDTEPPPNFHAWASIGAISALLGKKCVMPQGKFDVHPQLYIILVGEPGTRKSTAMNIAKKLVASVKGVYLASDSGSREGLMDEMAKNKVIATMNGADVSYWQSAIFVDEVGDLLGGEHIDGSMVRFLTTIWDQRVYKEATRKGGQVTIHNPYLTLLGCCPTKWMSSKLQQDVITDGLSRRTIFALETELNCLNPRPQNTPEQAELLAQLQAEARRMHSISGRFRLTKEACEVFDNEYLATHEKAKKFSDKVQSYFSSKHVLALKIAMCLSAGVDDSKKISSQVMRTAFSFLEQTERSLNEVFSGVGRNELKSHADRLLQKIRTSERGLLKMDIIKQFYDDLSTVELEEILTMLQNTGQIVNKTINALDAPRFVATGSTVVLPGVDLMPLARLLTPSSEEFAEEKPSSVPIHRLAPETERLLDHQKSSRLQTGSGILLKGRSAQVSGESTTPLQSPAS